MSLKSPAKSAGAGSGAGAGAGPGGAERRRFARRPVLATFSIFAVLPKKGPHRLQVHDLSEQGLSMDVDIDGEAHADFPIRSGESLEAHLYLNQSLYLPLSLKVIRVSSEDGLRRVGAELGQSEDAGHKAFHAFIAMVDRLTEAAVIGGPPAL